MFALRRRGKLCYKKLHWILRLSLTSIGDKGNTDSQNIKRTYDRLREGQERRSKKSTSFSIDRSGLINSANEGNDLNELINNKNKEALSPLAKDLLSYIKIRGPISLHEFIAQTSNHAVHGYYQNAADKIGVRGDFVTAPEISQLFGEMIGIWCLSAWFALGEPKEIRLIELGPGKGTLMKDILRVAAKFPKFDNAVRVHLVELSETMRKLQRESLECKGDTARDQQGTVNMTSMGGIPIYWHHMLQQIPDDENIPSLVVGQEFLDTFPVHQFVYTKNGWREKLVDIDTSDSPFYFRLVLSNNATPAVQALMMNRGDEPSFDPAPFAQKRELNAMLKNMPLQRDVADLRGHIPEGLHENDGIEISPLALATCEDIAKRICKTRGAALLIDYGENFTQADSLRAFKKHTIMNILSEPGITDITADVDFSACRKAVERKGAVACPVVGQGEFLQRMGIMERVERLIEADSTTDAQATLMLTSLRRLVEEKDMGKRFKVLGFSARSLPIMGFPER